jgi:hypothetical protein
MDERREGDKEHRRFECERRARSGHGVSLCISA